jgi:acetyl esterase
VVSLRARGDKRPPALQVLIYPAVDLTRSRASHATFSEGYYLTRGMIAWFCDHYLGGADPRHVDASPIFVEDLSGVAPALVYTAGFDPLRDEGKDYADRLREAGALIKYREFSDIVHGFVCSTGLIAASRRAREEIEADVRRALWKE